MAARQVKLGQRQAMARELVRRRDAVPSDPLHREDINDDAVRLGSLAPPSLTMRADGAEALEPAPSLSHAKFYSATCVTWLWVSRALRCEAIAAQTSASISRSRRDFVAFTHDRCFELPDFFTPQECAARAWP